MKIMIRFIFFLILFLFSAFFNIFAFQPKNLILGTPDQMILLADKSGCSLGVYQYDQLQKQFQQVKSYPCESGKRTGDKKIEGDERTPTGVYTLKNAWTGATLQSKYGSYAKVYGSGAFEMNYPNYLDRYLLNNNGSGIWLHGTIEKLPKATRGCISLGNDNLLDIGQYISLKQTKIVVADTVEMVSNQEMQETRKKLLDFIESWQSAWESDDVDFYLQHYSDKFKNAKFDMEHWKVYKKRVNQKNKNRRIKISEVSILKAKNIFHIQFKQDYQSSHINQVGYKMLYIIENNEQYSILSEEWSPLSRFQMIEHDVLPNIK